jgi:hypothetical protein
MLLLFFWPEAYRVSKQDGVFTGKEVRIHGEKGSNKGLFFFLEECVV